MFANRRTAFNQYGTDGIYQQCKGQFKSGAVREAQQGRTMQRRRLLLDCGWWGGSAEREEGVLQPPSRRG